MAEQSFFSKLPKKQLYLIATKLIDSSFPFNNPYSEDYSGAYDDLRNISKYFNIVVNDEDVQFFAKFIDINDDIISKIMENPKDNSLIQKLEIPVAKTYELHYTIGGTCTYTEYAKANFDSYDKDWVVDSANQQMSDGNWDMYNGSMDRETEYDNFDNMEVEFDDVIEVQDKLPKKESMLDRLVIENTSEVVGSLDKKTLLELRRIIDSKLRLL